VSSCHSTQPITSAQPSPWEGRLLLPRLASGLHDSAAATKLFQQLSFSSTIPRATLVLPCLRRLPLPDPAAVHPHTLISHLLLPCLRSHLASSNVLGPTPPSFLVSSGRSRPPRALIRWSLTELHHRVVPSPPAVKPLAPNQRRLRRRPHRFATHLHRRASLRPPHPSL
jgi:hypothetical protein